MPQQIDNLEIQLIANSTKATNALENFTTALSRLSGVVGSIQNASGLTNVANGISAIGNAMQSIKGMRGDSLNALTNALNTISNANSSGLNSTAEGIFNLTASLDIFNSGNLGDATNSLGNLSQALKNFGLASANKAIQNLPQLTSEISRMVNALSTLPEVKQNTLDAVYALSELASQGSRVGSAVNSITKATNGMNKSLKTTTKLFGRFSTLMGGILSITGAWNNIKGIINNTIGALWSKANSSMDYVETFNYFNVALGKIERQFGETYSTIGKDSADRFGKSFREELKKLNTKMTGYELGNNGELFNTDSIGLGLNPERMMNFQAQVLGITNSVGLLGDVSIDTAKNLSMLASDLSSLTNQDLETVMGNLTSGLIGQSRALYKYGIDITSATLAQTALAYGVSKTVSEMSQSEKMQLRMLAILDQSKIAWGDQANTINSVANQYRVFKEQIANLGRVLGNLFLPIVTKVLPFVNALVISLQRLFSTLGFKIFGNNWLKDLNSQINGGVSTEIDDIGEGLDDASASAKKLKNSLLGIDELNIIQKPDDSSGSGVGGIGGVDLSGAIADATADYEKVWNEALANAENKIQYYVEKISKTLDPLKKPLENLFKGIDEFNSNVGDGLKWIYDEIFKPLAEWTISDVIPTFLETLSDDLEVINELLADGKSVFEWYWDKLGKFSFNTSLNSLSEWLDKITQPIKTIKELFDGDFSIKEIFDVLSDGTSAVESLRHPIQTIFGGILDELWQSALTFVDEKFGTNLSEKFNNLEISVDGLKEKIWGFIDETSKTIVEEKLPALWESVKSFFSENKFEILYATVFGGVSLVWYKLVDWWKKKAISKWWDEHVKPWFEKDNWIFDGIPDGLKESFNTAIDTIKQIWNRFAEWLNEKLTWTIDPIQIAGKTIFDGATIQLGHVPTFQNGGFVEDGLFMANHNELIGNFSNGRTAVANNDQIIAGIRNGVRDANVTEEALLREQNQLLRQLLAKDTSVHIGDREIAKANNRGQLQLGKTLVIS